MIYIRFGCNIDNMGIIQRKGESFDLEEGLGDFLEEMGLVEKKGGKYQLKGELVRKAAATIKIKKR